MTCPGVNTDVDVIEGVSPLQSLIHHPHPLPHHCHCPHSLLLFSVIIIVTSASGCGFANMAMAMHGLCISGEIVQPAGTDNAKMVVGSPQVIHHCSFILTLFAAPGVESQATSSSQGLRGMDALEAHYLWPTLWVRQSKKVNVFWRNPCHSVIDPEVLLATPGLLQFIDLGAQEVG